MCRICGKSIGNDEEHAKLQEDFAKRSGVEWITQKKGTRGPLGLTKDYARKAQKQATKWAKKNCPDIADTITIHDRWQKDDWWRNTMTENGHDEHQILGMDALNKAPRPSEETLNKNRWSKDYRDDRLQGVQTIRRTDKTGGAGTIARTQEPDFDEVLSKKPRSENKPAGGDSGTSSSSNQWGQSSWKPQSQPSPRGRYQIAGKRYSEVPDRSSESGEKQWQPSDWQSRWRERQ